MNNTGLRGTIFKIAIFALGIGTGVVLVSNRNQKPYRHPKIEQVVRYIQPHLDKPNATINVEVIYE